MRQRRNVSRSRDAAAQSREPSNTYCRVKTAVVINFFPSVLVPSETIVLVLPSLEMVVFDVVTTDPLRFNVAIE